MSGAHPEPSRMASPAAGPSTALITNDIVLFGLIAGTLAAIF